MDYRLRCCAPAGLAARARGWRRHTAPRPRPPPRRLLPVRREEHHAGRACALSIAPAIASARRRRLDTGLLLCLGISLLGYSIALIFADERTPDGASPGARRRWRDALIDSPPPFCATRFKMRATSPHARRARDIAGRGAHAAPLARAGHGPRRRDAISTHRPFGYSPPKRLADEPGVGASRSALRFARALAFAEASDRAIYGLALRGRRRAPILGRALSRVELEPALDARARNNFSPRTTMRAHW